MTPAWLWDDEAVPNDDVLYKHTPCGDKQRKRQDPTTGKWHLTKAAFTRSELTAGGWSCFRQTLLFNLGLDVHAVRDSGTSPRDAWRLLVGQVRSSGAGVTDEEDPLLGQLGKAHAQIRLTSSVPSRSDITRVRSELIDVFTFCED